MNRFEIKEESSTATNRLAKRDENNKEFSSLKNQPDKQEVGIIFSLLYI